MKNPFSEAHRKILKQHYPLYRRMPANLQEDLRKRILVFLSEKRFAGCGGLQITDEMRVLVAAQACLLLLNPDTRFYPKLRTVCLYPDTYLARENVDMGGITATRTSSRLGESWNSGQVVLAWNAATHGASNPFDGHNVVYHEFAHRLDQENGRADGAPVLSKESAYRSWARVLGREYNTLVKRAKRRKKSVFDRYGATSPAEFFAVATETFFEKPRQLNRDHPELYEELKGYYRTDPLDWEG